MVVLCSLTAAVSVGGNPVTGLDHSVFRSVGHGVDPLGVVTAVAEVGDVRVIIVVLAVVAIVAAQLTWRVWPLLLAAGNGGVMAGVVEAMKVAVGRIGPGMVPGERPGYPGYFPSGHTAAAAVCIGTSAYLVAALWTRRRTSSHPSAPVAVGLGLGLAAGVVEGATTVLTVNHWTSDVVASLALSTVVIVVGCALARRSAD
ncbi:MAG TPA: phosphatase PAP2 family protein [Nocardioidaceae bacterium]|nr:phosphatase PAP2 family protein [Nocardioidaceae bacterium]